MFVLGGPVKGGRMYGRWPGLQQEHLYEGRDLAVTTDFRQVLSEAVSISAIELWRKSFPASPRTRRKTSSNISDSFGWSISHTGQQDSLPFSCARNKLRHVLTC
jgi:hypothetical protein